MQPNHTPQKKKRHRARRPAPGGGGRQPPCRPHTRATPSTGKPNPGIRKRSPGPKARRQPQQNRDRRSRSPFQGYLAGQRTPPASDRHEAPQGDHRPLLARSLDARTEDPSGYGSVDIVAGDWHHIRREESPIDFDWSDENAKEPPIAWDDVQSFRDFHDSTEAHEFWKWDRERLKWKHEDEKTGDTIYCPSELD